MIKKKFIIISLVSFLFAAIILLFDAVTDFRRIRKEIEILDRLNFISEVSSNTGLFPIHEKAAYLELLDYYDKELNYYLEEVNCSDDIKWKIYKIKHLILEQENRLDRLNNFLHEPIEIKESLEIKECIQYQKPFTEDLSTLQFIFSSPKDEDILAIKVNVYIDGSLVYSRQYENKSVNSIVVPHSPGTKERIELGYITKDNKFKYIVYGEM